MGPAACSRVVERPGERVVAGIEADAEGSVRPPVDAFVQATIDIACLSSRVADPRERVGAVWKIYQRHGFDDPGEYLEMVRSVGQQPGVQERIARGIEQCR